MKYKITNPNQIWLGLALFAGGVGLALSTNMYFLAQYGYWTVLPGLLLAAAGIYLVGNQVGAHNPKDFWSGVMFAVIGFAFAIIVKQFEYPMGTGSRMGPGYFPFVLGIIMGLVGVGILIQSLATTGPPLSKFAWKPLFWILGGVVLFGLIAKVAGLALSIIALVAVSAYGGDEFKIKEVVIASLILAAFSVAVFIYGLKLSFPVWPSFIAG